MKIVNCKLKIRKPITYYMGNLLIFLAIGGLLFIYFPFIQLYFFSPKMEDVSHRSGYFIEIPKIKAQAPVILNVDPWKETEYRPKLKEGVAQARGTARPGEEGITYLFAHSSDYPWNIGRYNTVFFKLDELNFGDEIIIYVSGTKYIYKVKDKKIVWPDQTEYLTKTIGDKKNLTKKQIILQTCYPIGTAFQRLLIFAEK